MASESAQVDEAAVQMEGVTLESEPSYDKEKAAALLKEIGDQGAKVRALKEAGGEKDAVDAELAQLLRLKEQYTELTGEDVPGAKKAKKKAKKVKKEKKDKPQQQPSKKKKKKIEAFHFVNKTPEGDKKDMTEPMLDSYHPEAVEAAWNAWWEKQGYFAPDVEAARAAGEEGRFVMVIPPPNVTGTLHLGHALTCAIEDTLARWHRMCGKPVCWLPGTDHAGIATQVVVEKKLMKEEGLSRHDLGRTKFLDRVWEWKEAHGNTICNQLRRIGASVDWSREVFTMDEGRSKAVTEAFVRMFDKGRIYRRVRLVNWCCALRTAISDIEVDYIDVEGRTKLSVPGHEGKHEFGTLTSFAYKLDGRDEEVVVATTRLETMLGDTAIAVHPEDPRYKHLHGALALHPFSDRKIPIVTDADLVDMNFGTGAVKITPAHDPNDFMCGQRHQLPQVNIFTDDGCINANGGPFAGMKRFEGRVAVEKELDRMGLLRGKEDNKMRLGLCSRSGDVIEPVLKPQWWVGCKEMADRACEVVRSGELDIQPEFHRDTWFRWLENIRDWCISRQLWWGHRIPAYFVSVRGLHLSEEPSETELGNADQEAISAEAADATDRWVVARTEEEARRQAAEHFGVAEGAVYLSQDPDVLDTWFSSGLFPFSTFGWPDDDKGELGAFYPGTLLETGHDILFFWVARMVMMGLELTDALPFRTVYLHAMVRDKYGRKMSKSRGNVIDPLEVISGAELEQLHEKLRAGNLDAKEVERAVKGQKLDYPDGIPECGADALRFGLLAYTLQGRDVNLDINRVVGYRQFCNKLWNATKFAMMNLEGFAPTAGVEEAVLDSPGIALRDRWILHKLSEAAAACNDTLGSYHFAETTTAIYNFWLYHLCDVYLELIKPVMRGSDGEAKLAAQRTLWIALDQGLRLLHPIMPFVTEELWQRLPGRGTLGESESIMLSPYPQGRDAWLAPEVDESMRAALDAIHGARSMRGAYKVPPSKVVPIYVTTKDAARFAHLSAHSDDIATLARADLTILDPDGEAPSQCATQVVDAQCSVHAELKGLVDVDAEVKKLNKQLQGVVSSLENLEKQVAMPGYEDKVPEKVRAKNSEKLEGLRSKQANITEAIKSMEAMRE